MKFDLMALHKRLKHSTSPSILIRKFPTEYRNWDNFKEVPKEAYDFWLQKQSSPVKREIELMKKTTLCLRTYLEQCGYNVETSISRLVRYGFLERNGTFKEGSRYGVGFEVYLPVHPNIMKHLTDDQVVRPRCSVAKMPLEEALFLCDSPLSIDEAKERIQALGLISKVSIKGESWRVPAELPYDL